MFSLVLKVEFSGGLWLENSTFNTKMNSFLSSGSILIFLLEATQGDHIRLKLEMCTKNLVLLGVVDKCHLLLNDY